MGKRYRAAQLGQMGGRLLFMDRVGEGKQVADGHGFHLQIRQLPADLFYRGFIEFG